MSGVGNVNRLVPGLIERLDVNQGEMNRPESKSESNFTEIFSNMVQSVDNLQKESSQVQAAMMAGEPVELHQVMIKAEEAGIAMDLLLQVRNKLVDAYNELMRMPI
jgi:flagellar hook-basal body complex protein FliE